MHRVSEDNLQVQLQVQWEVQLQHSGWVLQPSQKVYPRKRVHPRSQTLYLIQLLALPRITINHLPRQLIQHPNQTQHTPARQSTQVALLKLHLSVVKAHLKLHLSILPLLQRPPVAVNSPLQRVDVLEVLLLLLLLLLLPLLLKGQGGLRRNLPDILSKRGACLSNVLLSSVSAIRLSLHKLYIAIIRLSFTSFTLTILARVSGYNQSGVCYALQLPIRQHLQLSCY